MFQNLFGTLGTKSPGSLPSPEPLLKAMYGVAQKDTRDSRDVLYGEFLKCWLWLCTPELPEGWKPGMTTLSTGMNIQITTPNNARGEKVLPAFTDGAALANYDPNTPHLALPGKEVFKIAVRIGVAQVLINPFDPLRKPIRPGGILVSQEFTTLAHGAIPKRTPDGKNQVLTVQKGTQVQIGRNKLPVSDQIKAGINQAALTFPDVEKIFRYRMRYVDTGSEAEVFGVVCDAPGERLQSIMEALMSAIQPLIPSGSFVDFTKLDPSQMQLMQLHGEIVFDRTRSAPET